RRSRFWDAAATTRTATKWQKAPLSLLLPRKSRHCHEKLLLFLPCFATLCNFQGAGDVLSPRQQHSAQRGQNVVILGCILDRFYRPRLNSGMMKPIPSNGKIYV